MQTEADRMRDSQGLPFKLTQPTAKTDSAVMKFALPMTDVMRSTMR